MNCEICLIILFLETKYVQEVLMPLFRILIYCQSVSKSLGTMNLIGSINTLYGMDTFAHNFESLGWSLNSK